MVGLELKDTNDRTNIIVVVGACRIRAEHDFSSVRAQRCKRETYSFGSLIGSVAAS